MSAIRTRASERQIIVAGDDLTAAVTAMIHDDTVEAVKIINDADPVGLAFTATIICSALLEAFRQEVGTSKETIGPVFADIVREALAQ